VIRHLLCTLHSAAWAWERWTPDETIDAQQEALSRASDGYVPAEMHEELRQSLLTVARERDEARAECGQFRAALERAERSINSQTDEAETRALEAEDRADSAEKRIAGLEDDAQHYVQAIEALTRRAEAAERDLSRSSYWKRGEPGEPRRLVVQWCTARREPVHALSTHHYAANLEGWYAEALGAPPREEVIRELEAELARTWQPWPPLVRDGRSVMTGVVDWHCTTADTDWAGEHRVYHELTEEDGHCEPVNHVPCGDPECTGQKLYEALGGAKKGGQGG
jgi:hypothetical protein